MPKLNRATDTDNEIVKIHISTDQHQNQHQQPLTSSIITTTTTSISNGKIESVKDAKHDNGSNDDMDTQLWDLSERGKQLALALLGNRSLAKRKVGDVKGALNDACRCLRPDENWIRGYVRKAAALREDQRIEEAQAVAKQ